MTETPEHEDRLLDTDALKGLAHPLRAELFETLSAYGPATASGLADRLGESSGATSYHLRQLARHGLVREVEGRGTARERWWERVPGGITVEALEFPEHSAGREASRRVSNEFERHRARLLRDFVERGLDVLDPAWLRPTQLSTANLRLTVEELAELQQRLDRAFEDVVASYRGRSSPGSRPVQAHINLFPIVDGELTEDAR